MPGVIAIVVFACCGVWAGVAAQAEADPRWPTVRRLLTEEAWAEAIVALNALVRDYPADAAARRDLARALDADGRWGEALSHLDHLLATNPLDETVALHAATIHGRHGHWQRAIVRLEPLIQRGRGSYAVHHALGEAYAGLGELLEASWHYTHAVQLNPGARDDFVQLGRIHLERGLSALAVRAFESALQLDEREPAVHLLMARALAGAGRVVGQVGVRPFATAIPETIRDGVYVIEAVPDEPNRYLVASEHSAIYHLQRAADLAVEAGVTLDGLELLRADLWLQAGRHETARDLYEALAAAVAPSERAGYHRRYSQALCALGDLTGCLREFEQAVEFDAAYSSEAGAVYEFLADRYCLLGEVEPYIRFLERVLELSPRRVDLRYRLAGAYDEAGRPDDAHRQFLIILQVDPHHPQRATLLERLSSPPQAAPPLP